LKKIILISLEFDIYIIHKENMWIKERNKGRECA